MALIHQATMSPTKMGLLASWLPRRPWGSERRIQRQVGSYRFDDPADEVGLEAFILQAEGGVLLHVPLTYRGARLAGADSYLIGTAEHSVLGHRWVYDGCRDPAWVRALLEAMMSDDSEATEFVDVDGVRQRRPSSVRVMGTGVTPQQTLASVGSVVHVIEDGDSTRVRVDSVVLGVVRVLGSETLGSTTLTASWSGEAPVAIARVAGPARLRRTRSKSQGLAGE